MSFTWESLLWRIKECGQLTSGVYTLRALYVGGGMPGDDGFAIPPLKEFTQSNPVEIELDLK